MKRGLGRGLDSLFGGFDEESNEQNVGSDNSDNIESNSSSVINESVVVSGKPEEIDIGLIDRNPAQPRTNFDEDALSELSDSIKVHGVIQPIIVKRNGDRYTIIAGERRWRASRQAGLKTIPCILKDYSEREMSEIAIIENLQRENLNPIESARAIKNLIEDYNLTQEEVAEKIGKSRPLVANSLRLLSLPESIIALVESNKLSAGHARAILGVADSVKQKEIAISTVQKGLSVREVENLVRFANMPQSNPTSVKKDKSPELKEFERGLKRSLGTRVQIKGDDQKGKIIIDYYTSDDLNRIFEILGE